MSDMLTIPLTENIRILLDNAPLWTVWVHRKGGIYTVVSHHGRNIIYVSHDTRRIWYRDVLEYLDGRFTKIDAAPLTLLALEVKKG